MEFPDLGAHCTEPSCKRLDFLPLKCDACEQLFCTDHITYAHHNCTSAYKKDIQVPVCPLCSTPIPVKRGEMPDVVVGAHIDQDCKSDPAQRKRKIFTNKCQRPGCKQREMMKVLCDQCHGNFCLKHRHPLDHDCKGTGHSLSKAGNAAIARAQRSAKEPTSTTSSNETMRSPTSQPTSSRASKIGRGAQPQSTSAPVIALQNGLSEEAALQRALEMSLAEMAPIQPQPPRCSVQQKSVGLCHRARLLAENHAVGHGRGTEKCMTSRLPVIKYRSVDIKASSLLLTWTLFLAAPKRRKIWHWLEPFQLARKNINGSSCNNKFEAQNHPIAACPEQHKHHLAWKPCLAILVLPSLLLGYLCSTLRHSSDESRLIAYLDLAESLCHIVALHDDYIYIS